MTEEGARTLMLEIAELANGDVVLRQSGEDGAPLVRIRFSEASSAWLGEGRLRVARAMFEAGIREAAREGGGELMPAPERGGNRVH